MGRFIQPSNGKGSLKDIQLLVNKNKELINSKIKSAFPELVQDKITWQSPLETDELAEYRDNEFINKVGLDTDEINLNEFWPKKGPQWDALAITDKGSIILVEAKANIPEIVTPGTGAGSISKNQIVKSLNELKIFLNRKDEIDWSGKFYQYTNRLAHLFFLRQKRRKKAFLLNIYFIGDKNVNGPSTEGEWKAALQVMYSYLGLTRHKLSKFMADIFIHVDDLKNN